MKALDFTHRITPEMPVYPGTEPPGITPVYQWAQHGFRETALSLFSHTGTHIDAPAHLFEFGKQLDDFPPEQFFGTALVIDCRDAAPGTRVGVERLLPYGKDAERADFLLFCFGWDRFWGTEAYFKDFPCIDSSLAEFINRYEKKGVGVDTISIDPIEDASLPIHKKILGTGKTLILENLAHLHQAEKKPYFFTALPLKWIDSDGAPARAVAIVND